MKSSRRSNPQFAPRTNSPQDRILTLHVVLSNGSPSRDTTLKFEFDRRALGVAHLWMLKLPRVRNPDAVARLIATNVWELRLNVFDDTQPIEVQSYTPEQIGQWVEKNFNEPGDAPAELLILGHDGQFTLSLAAL